MDDVALAEAGGIEPACEAPIVRPRPFRVVDRAGRGEDPGEPAGDGGVQATERQEPPLDVGEVRLAQDRQGRERRPRADAVRLDLAQMLPEPGRVVERVPDQPRQGIERDLLALERVADFLAVVVAVAALRHEAASRPR